MYCPKCGKENRKDNRFCSGCGLSLGMVQDLMSSDPGSLDREKQTVTGTILVMTGGFLALIYLIILGIITLPHVNTFAPFLMCWILFVAASLSVTGIGFVKLIRSGFFKEIKERELRIKLAQIEQKRRPAIANTSENATRSLPPPEPPPVTEVTTRELRPKSGNLIQLPCSGGAHALSICLPSPLPNARNCGLTPHVVRDNLVHRLSGKLRSSDAGCHKFSG